MKRDKLLGILIVFLPNIILEASVWFSTLDGITSYNPTLDCMTYLFSLWSLIYLIPAYIFLKQEGKKGIIKSVVYSYLLLFILNIIFLIYSWNHSDFLFL